MVKKEIVSTEDEYTDIEIGCFGANNYADELLVVLARIGYEVYFGPNGGVCFRVELDDGKTVLTKW